MTDEVKKVIDKKQYYREYYQRNKDKIKDRLKNKYGEKRKEYFKKYYEENKEKILKDCKEYYYSEEKNEKIKARNREYKKRTADALILRIKELEKKVEGMEGM